MLKTCSVTEFFPVVQLTRLTIVQDLYDIAEFFVIEMKFFGFLVIYDRHGLISPLMYFI